ncbi:MAG: lysophospholipid acyltransferase family protein [Planctomycetota bacterium]
MKFRFPGLTGATGCVIAHGIRAWMSTLRYEAVFAQPDTDPALGVGGPRIYLVWHESMLAPIYLRAGCRVAILVSKHRDADLLESIARHSGYECVRGSTARGGAAALKQLVARGQTHNLVITPDGPRGPRRHLAPGPVFLASKLGIPIVPMGFAYDRKHRLNSWDRFAIPRPFSTARVFIGEEIRVPARLGRDGLERQRVRVQDAMRRANELVEAWAAGGAAPAGSRVVRRSKGATPFPQGVVPVRRAA